MNEEQLLLAQIIANPDDDTLRLVYADKLDENGKNQRAEFIRVQVELAKWPERVVVHEETVVDRHGPDCFTAVHPLFEVGKRVDLLKPSSLSGKYRKMKPMYGLLVSKEFSPEEADRMETVGDYDSVLIRDEQSGPEPEEVGRLRNRNKEMLSHGLTNPNCGVTVKPEWFRRGFLERLELTAEDFLKCCDRLVWHEEMIDWCPECEGKGTLLGASPDRGNPECGRCDKGRVPRPCPLTAHPIRGVKITDRPLPFARPKIEVWKENCQKWGVKIEVEGDPAQQPVPEYV